MSMQLPPLATPAEVAEYLRTTTAALAQDRYRWIGPKFIKHGSRCFTAGQMCWIGWIANLCRYSFHAFKFCVVQSPYARLTVAVP